MGANHPPAHGRGFSKFLAWRPGVYTSHLKKKKKVPAAVYVKFNGINAKSGGGVGDHGSSGDQFQS